MAKVKKIDGGAKKAVNETEEAEATEVDPAAARDAESSEDDAGIDADDANEEVESAGPERTGRVVAFWEKMRVDPVEIALPGGVGFTLRAYRPESELTLSEVDREEDDFTILERGAADTGVDFEDLDEDLDADGVAAPLAAEDDESDIESDDEADEGVDTEEDNAEADTQHEAAEADEEPSNEEVPVFLGHAGWLYLFRTREALVEFVRSDSDHDFAQLDSWSQLRKQLTVDDVAPDQADRYELDLVVENLRGGHDVWDADLIIRAGEIARDLGYALRITPILSALGTGSPLDDLDEALRNAQEGGFGGFFARRRLKKIGIQQAALGWRTIIGKISAAVDWRE